MRDFQQGAGLTVGGVVGPNTWAALPDGGPMPTLQRGSHGDVVRDLQRVLQEQAPPVGDGAGGDRRASSARPPRPLRALQTWGHLTGDGVVGDQTWSVSLHAASATLESAVGLQYVKVLTGAGLAASPLAAVASSPSERRRSGTATWPVSSSEARAFLLVQEARWTYRRRPNRVERPRR